MPFQLSSDDMFQIVLIFILSLFERVTIHLDKKSFSERFVPIQFERNYIGMSGFNEHFASSNGTMM